MGGAPAREVGARARGQAACAAWVWEMRARRAFCCDVSAANCVLDERFSSNICGSLSTRAMSLRRSNLAKRAAAFFERISALAASSIVVVRVGFFDTSLACCSIFLQSERAALTRTVSTTDAAGGPLSLPFAGGERGGGGGGTVGCLYDMATVAAERSTGPSRNAPLRWPLAGSCGGSGGGGSVGCSKKKPSAAEERGVELLLDASLI